jgi:hypothetical protein
LFSDNGKYGQPLDLLESLIISKLGIEKQTNLSNLIII